MLLPASAVVDVTAVALAATPADLQKFKKMLENVVFLVKKKKPQTLGY